MTTSIYDRVQYRSNTYGDGSPMLITLRTQQALDRLWTALGYSEPLTMWQGSFHDGQLSGGTHSGADVVDLDEYEYARKAELGAKIGIIVYHRPFNWDGKDGMAHCHCLVRGSKQFSPEAAAQIGAWDKKENGLVGEAPYTTGPWYPVGDFHWTPQHKPAQPPQQPGQFQVMVDLQRDTAIDHTRAEGRMAQLLAIQKDHPNWSTVQDDIADLTEVLARYKASYRRDYAFNQATEK